MTRELAGLVRADILERVRRPSFPLTLAPAVYLGYTVHAGFWTMRHGGFRAEFGAAYVGVMTALLSGMLLGLFGFYLVKTTIARDRSTGVGQILAATPMRAVIYTLAKALGNFTILAAMVSVLVAAAWFVTVAGGDSQVAWMRQVFAPFLLLALPMMAVVGALAVLFETIPWLRGGFGNVVWLFLWAMLPAAAIQTGSDWLDLSGLGTVQDSLLEAQHLAYPEEAVDLISLNAGPSVGALRTFPWHGVHWTPTLIGKRLSWLALAFALAVLAAIPFDRFDPARTRKRRRRPDWLLRRARGARESLYATTAVVAEPPVPAEDGAKWESAAQGFAAGTVRTNAMAGFPRLLRAELKLLLGDHPTIWYLGALGLLVAEVTAPVALLQRYLLPLVWIWPLLVWSRMGTSARRHGTEALLDAAPRPVLRQLPAVWTAGVAIALLAGAPAILRLLLTGTPGALTSLGGVLFVPSLALALGLWSGTPRLFEVVFLMIWYVGPLNGMTPFDFLGVTPTSIEMGPQGVFALLSVPLLGSAVLARGLRLRR